MWTGISGVTTVSNSLPRGRGPGPRPCYVDRDRGCSGSNLWNVPQCARPCYVDRDTSPSRKLRAPSIAGARSRACSVDRDTGGGGGNLRQFHRVVGRALWTRDDPPPRWRGVRDAGSLILVRQSVSVREPSCGFPRTSASGIPRAFTISHSYSVLQHVVFASPR